MYVNFSLDNFYKRTEYGAEIHSQTLNLADYDMIWTSDSVI